VQVFAKFFGTQRIEVSIPTDSGDQPRYYVTANNLVQEAIDARVWAGAHYRVSGVIGADLGRKVAQWTLNRYFLPED
jgi:hypothetical protein